MPKSIRFSFGKDTILYGFFIGIGKGSQLFLLPILTSIFSPSDYGVIEYITIFVGFIGAISSLSLESAVARMWSEKNDHESKSQLYSTVLLSVSIFCLFLFLAIYLLNQQEFFSIVSSHQITNEFLLAVATGLIVTITSIPQIILRIERKVISYGLTQLINGILSLGICIVLVSTFKIGLAGLYIGYFVASLIGLTASVISTRVYLYCNISLNLLNQCLTYSAPLIPGILLMWLSSQIDKYILLSNNGMATLGIYAAATKVALIIGFLVEIFRLTWFPFALKAINHRNQNYFFSLSMTGYLYVMLAAALPSVLFSKEILVFLSNASYSSGYQVIPFLVLSQILVGSFNITNMGMLITKKTKLISVAAIVGVVINILVTNFLVNHYGLTGAAIGSCLSALAITAILCSFSLRVVQIDFDFKYISQTMSIFLIVTFISIFSHKINLEYSTFNKCIQLFIVEFLLVMYLLKSVAKLKTIANTESN